MAKRLWQAFTVLGLIFTIQLTVNAQIIQVNKLTITVGAETGKVTAYEGAYHNVEAGSTLQLQYGLSKRLALTLTSGYYNFLPKTRLRLCLQTLGHRLKLRFFSWQKYKLRDIRLAPSAQLLNGPLSLTSERLSP